MAQHDCMVLEPLALLCFGQMLRLSPSLLPFVQLICGFHPHPLAPAPSFQVLSLASSIRPSHTISMDDSSSPDPGRLDSGDASFPADRGSSRGWAVGGASSKGPSAGMKVLLQQGSLAVWGNLAWLSVPQLCELLFCFGRVGWRPGPLLRDLVAMLGPALQEALEDAEGRDGAEGAEQGGQGALHAAIRGVWGLARLQQRTYAARAVLALVTGAALDALSPSNRTSATASTAGATSGWSLEAQAIILARLEAVSQATATASLLQAYGAALH